MIWYGNAGHLCVSSDCRFHLCTEVNGYLVSTVGEYYPYGEKTMKPVGLMPKDLYETMVFKMSGSRCKCGCGLPDIILSALICDRYATPKEANENHMKYCEEYAKKKSPEELDRELEEKQANCQHGVWEPTFQGGDTYRCKLCGKEVDMTEDESP